MIVRTNIDKLKLKCTATGTTCAKSSEKELDLNDLLQYGWEAEKGSFPRDNIGREVVWQAPDEVGKVKIKVKIREVGGQYDDGDKEFETVIPVCGNYIKPLIDGEKAWREVADYLRKAKKYIHIKGAQSKNRLSCQ